MKKTVAAKEAIVRRGVNFPRAARSEFPTRSRRPLLGRPAKFQVAGPLKLTKVGFAKRRATNHCQD